MYISVFPYFYILSKSPNGYYFIINHFLRQRSKITYWDEHVWFHLGCCLAWHMFALGNYAVTFSLLIFLISKDLAFIFFTELKFRLYILNNNLLFLWFLCLKYYYFSQNVYHLQYCFQMVIMKQADIYISDKNVAMYPSVILKPHNSINSPGGSTFSLLSRCLVHILNAVSKSFQPFTLATFEVHKNNSFTMHNEYIYIMTHERQS